MTDNLNIKKFLNIPGEVRGDVLRTDLEYIKKKEGAQGLKKFEAQIKDLGLDITRDKIKNTRWYPVGYKALLLELARKKLNWKDRDMIKMGKMASTQSFITRTILRYFVSLEKTFQETPKYWHKYWYAGEFIPH
jgi:hypothetical protein